MEEAAPIGYRVVVSPRGRQVRLQMHPERGLSVHIPRGFDPALVPGIVEDHRDWIRRQAERVTAYHRPEEPLPATIQLPAIDATWELVSMPPMKGRHELLVEGQRLILCSYDLSAGRQLLRRWLQYQAKRVLFAALKELADKQGLMFRRFGVRLQTTRWGSCSTRGAISLNAKLLFLPPRLVRYVLHHELCHLIHPNHSSAYWSELERMEPGAKELDRELKRATSYVPGWAR